MEQYLNIKLRKSFQIRESLLPFYLLPLSNASALSFPWRFADFSPPNSRFFLENPEIKGKRNIFPTPIYMKSSFSRRARRKRKKEESFTPFFRSKRYSDLTSLCNISKGKSSFSVLMTDGCDL